jgi:hypothetical protein
LRNDSDHASASPILIACDDCSRTCVDIGARLSQFGWRSRSVAGRLRWTCNSCLGSVPNLAALRQTVSVRLPWSRDESAPSSTEGGR